MTGRARLFLLGILLLSAVAVALWRATAVRDISPPRFRVVQRLDTPTAARPLSVADLAVSARQRWQPDGLRAAWTRVQSGRSTTLRSPRLDLPEDFYGVVITQKPRPPLAEPTVILWSDALLLDGARFARNRREITPSSRSPTATLLQAEAMLSDERRPIHYLFLHVPDAVPIDDVIESVAIVTTTDLAAASLSVTRVAADGRTRDAITSTAPLTYRLSVPASAELSFGVRVPAAAADAPVQVTQRIGNQNHVLIDTMVPTGKWVDFRVPIQQAPESTLLLAVDRGESTESGAPVYWSVPQILAADITARPNIILLVVDALRADKLGVYGATTGVSPAIDRLAAESLVYKRAYAAASWTKPSIATLLTSLYPTTHGLGSRQYADPLADNVPTLQGLLARDGYITVQFSANPFTGPVSNLDRGFDDALMAPALGHASAFDVEASDLNNGFERWLSSHPRDRFFAYLHAVDTHGAKSLAEYEAAITVVDGAIARLRKRLEDLHLADDTLLIVTADHGEAFGDHGRSGHGQSVYEEEIRVPLVLHGPGRIAPGAIDDPVLLVDLMPTLLEYAGVAFDKHALQGRSLVTRANTAVSPSPVVATRSTYPDDVDAPGDRVEMHALVDYPWKLIAIERGRRGPVLELYRLDRDPLERENLSATEPDRARQLASVLESFLHNQADARARFTALHGSARPVRARPTRDLVDQLRSLGYVR